MNTVKLRIELETKEASDIIMALLSDQNPNGFEENETELCAYFSEADFDEPSVNECLANYKFSKEIMPQQNWNATWESNFEPIRINDEVGIRAHFHPAANNIKHDIVITPKMSFGTGHHDTTWLVSKTMFSISFTNTHVLDMLFV